MEKTALSCLQIADSAGSPFSVFLRMGRPVKYPEAESDDNHNDLLAESQGIIAEVSQHRNHLLSVEKMIKLINT
ncbi:MAG: hypothetical protein WC445_04915 [Patescibacteria group bacterium]|jgi:hypothetical protein